MCINTGIGGLGRQDGGKNWKNAKIPFLLLIFSIFGALFAHDIEYN